MMYRFISTCAACVMMISGPSVSVAQSSLDDLVTVEVLDGGQSRNGTYVTALRLVLSDGWKTYWRAPGEAGIPPQFDWADSANIASVNYIWPTPHVFDQNGMQSIGYENQMVLPVQITPRDANAPVQLRGRVDIGLCKDICIPGSLTVDHTLQSDAKRHPAIAAAMAQRPYSRKEAGVRSATCRLSPIEGGMRLDAKIAMPSSGGEEVAVIEPGNAMIWASQTETRRDGNVLHASSDLVHIESGPFMVDRSAVRITVLGKKHAVDIVGCAAG